MDWAGWITAVCRVLEYPLVDASSATPTGVPDFDSILPAAIDYTENRIQRDLDFIASTVTTATGVMAPNKRQQALPSVNLPSPSQIPSLVGTPIAPDSIITTSLGSMIANVYWPGYPLNSGQDVSILLPLKVGGLTLGGVYQNITAVDLNNFTINTGFAALSSDSATILGDGIFIVCTSIRPIVNGKRLQPLEVVTRDALDFFWPDEDSPGANILPVQWCENDETSVLVGPAPDKAYGFEVVGTMRFPQLSSANTYNFLTKQVPDLYLAASLVFFSGYQGGYGAAANDPGMADHWEGEYQKLLKSAVVEEMRKNFANMSPSPSNPISVKASG